MEQSTHSNDITVCENGSVIDKAYPPLWRLPDGRCGAKWRGAVFALSALNTIDVTSEPFAPARCTIWPEEEPPRLRALHGANDETDFYLFIDGDVTTRDHVTSQLRDNGFSVVRWGANLSGEPGDWFIRLAPVPAEQRDRLAQLVAGPAVVPEAGDALRLRLLAESLTAAVAARQRLSAEVAALHAALADQQDSSAAVAHLQDELIALTSRLAEAEAAAQAVRTPSVPPREPPSRWQKEVAAMAEILLPRLTLTRDSLDFLAVELPERTHLWKALAELDRSDRSIPPAWKQLAGHRRWWERHFSTGQDNQGRIYARHSAETDRWQVLVSHKQNQAADLRRLD